MPPDLNKHGDVAILKRLTLTRISHFTDSDCQELVMNSTQVHSEHQKTCYISVLKLV